MRSRSAALEVVFPIVWYDYVRVFEIIRVSGSCWWAYVQYPVQYLKSGQTDRTLCSKQRKNEKNYESNVKPSAFMLSFSICMRSSMLWRGVLSTMYCSTMFILLQFFISQNLNNVWVRMEGYNWSWSVVGIQYACKVQYRSTDTESVTPNSELHKQQSTMHYSALNPVDYLKWS